MTVAMLFRGVVASCVSVLFANASLASCVEGFPAKNPDAAYVVLSDGTAVDVRTGLMWKRCAEGQTWDGAACAGTRLAANWQLALAIADASTFAGHTDWRVPNIKELMTLVETCGANGPRINRNVFPHSVSMGTNTWSSTPEPASMAWYVNFGSGEMWETGRANSSNVLLVREAQ
jgi:hypothetical protein